MFEKKKAQAYEMAHTHSQHKLLKKVAPRLNSGDGSRSNLNLHKAGMFSSPRYDSQMLLGKVSPITKFSQ